MAQYEITVRRMSKKGRLSFAHGEIKVDTTCWWDPKVVIDARPEGYPCHATRMASKTDSVTREKRPGIWFGKNVKYDRGTKTSNGIFIHEGRNTTWSDGCIVCERDQFMKIWNTIPPSATPNVLVKVIDERLTS